MEGLDFNVRANHTKYMFSMDEVLGDEGGLKFQLKHKDTFIFLQYIGFNDKNGSKVYKGDILKNDNGDIYEVVWDEKELRRAMKDHTEAPNTGIIGFAWYINNQYHHLEKLGNIHENHDLLSKSEDETI